MGPTLSGLDKLLKLPTGCGEQNMLKFAPNIYVLQYLTNTNRLDPTIEAKALQFLKTGILLILYMFCLICRPMYVTTDDFNFFS